VEAGVSPAGARRATRTTALTSGPAAWQYCAVAKTQTKKPRTTAKKKPARTTAKRRATPSRAAAAPAQRAPRRAIFIDVENTSSEEGLAEVLESLRIDRATQPTELTAVGNWRAVGQRLGRHLASLGAQLVHSAPALGVRDWSDLWIAVAAGCWLGQAAPGDVLEIVSNDRAFDAVGDAAAARGVIYRRLLHRRGAVAAATADGAAPKRRPRGGRRRRRPHSEPRPLAAAAAARADRAVAAVDHLSGIEPHGATREQIMGVINRLTNGDRWVNLDVLEKALKAEGFSRPPGSPRLVTRLRTLKEVEVDSHGRVRITPGATPSEPAPPGDSAPAAAPAKRRRKRRSKASTRRAADALPLQ
jgi:hypothetical protein